MMNFYISDTHFNHSRIIQFSKRPFKSVQEMNQTIIDNWNKRVKAKDSVYIIGDFAFGNGAQVNALLDSLNGTKYLIKGNHDDSFLRYNTLDTLKFGWVKDYAMIKDGEYNVVLFHFPIAVWEKRHHNSIHLYGHIHPNGNKTNFPLPEGNSACVCAERVNYTPISLKEILKTKIDFKNEETQTPRQTTFKKLQAEFI